MTSIRYSLQAGYKIFFSTVSIETILQLSYLELKFLYIHSNLSNQLLKLFKNYELVCILNVFSFSRQLIQAFFFIIIFAIYLSNIVSIAYTKISTLILFKKLKQTLKFVIMIDIVFIIFLIISFFFSFFF